MGVSFISAPVSAGLALTVNSSRPLLSVPPCSCPTSQPSLLDQSLLRLTLLTFFHLKLHMVENGQTNATDATTHPLRQTHSGKCLLPIPQADTTCGASSQAELTQNLILKTRMLRFLRHSRQKCCKQSFFKHQVSLTCQ